MGISSFCGTGRKNKIDKTGVDNNNTDEENKITSIACAANAAVAINIASIAGIASVASAASIAGIVSVADTADVTSARIKFKICIFNSQDAGSTSGYNASANIYYF